jgi:CheY-like chemotaxis protein
MRHPAPRILIVSDSSDNRRLFRHQIGESPKYFESSNTRMLAELVASALPDVVVYYPTGHSPSGSCISAIRELRALPCPQPGLIVVANEPDGRLVFRCIAAGADRVFVAPVDGARLRDTVLQLAARRTKNSGFSEPVALSSPRVSGFSMPVSNTTLHWN